MTATGIYDDGSSQDLTDAVTWASSDPQVASVSATGLVMGGLVAGGTSVVSASLGATQGSTVVSVGGARLVSIAVAAVPPLPVARTAQFTAIGTFDDRSTEDLTSIVAWSSSDTSVATISSPGGLATGAAVGTTTIVATDRSVSPSVSSPGTLLTVNDAKLVSIEDTPASATISVSGTQQFTAVGTFSDHIKRPLAGSVTWSSSNTAAATISPRSGLATGVAAGSASITARDGDVTSPGASLTVSRATLRTISVTPLTATTLLDEPVGFKAIAFYSDLHEEDVTGSATWSSSDTSVATVVTGDAAPVGAGTTRIKAAVGGVSGFSPLTVSSSTVKSITISPSQSNDPGNPTSNPSLAVGDSGQFIAIATLQDGETLLDVTKSTHWTSSDPAVSIQTVGGSAPGLATAVSDRQGVRITATYKNAQPVSVFMDVGGAMLMSIAVYSTDNAIKNGGTLQYRAVGYYDDNTTRDLTTQVAWASTNTAAATVGTGGLVTGGAATGTFTVIYATYGTGADAVTGALNLQANPAAQNQTTIPMQIVNNTGYPDEAVYLTTYSPVSNGYYNAFTKDAMVAGMPAFFTAGPTSCGPQYSYPLASLTSVGAHTWQFDCPTGTWGTTSFNFSTGGPLVTGTIDNGKSPPNNYQAAAFSATPTVPFNLFEPDFLGTQLFCDISNVDQFSLPMHLQVSGTTTLAVGNHAFAREAEVNGLAVSPAFSSLAQRHNFTTIDALAGGKAGGLVDTSKLYASLDAAIDRGWTRYQGSSNALVDWQNANFTFKPAAGSANDINVTVKGDGPDYVVSFQKPTTAEVLQGVPPFSGTSSAGSLRLQAVIAACLQRGVFDTYTDWGDPSDQFGYPAKYYVTPPFNVYAELQHHSSIDQKNYAFSSDDEYKQDPSTGNFNIAGAKLTVTLHPVNRAR